MEILKYLIFNKKADITFTISHWSVIRKAAHSCRFEVVKFLLLLQQQHIIEAENLTHSLFTNAISSVYGEGQALNFTPPPCNSIGKRVLQLMS